jgi:Lrp/AsnC family transcriptional regulator for asnA, asnC and gidA
MSVEGFGEPGDLDRIAGTLSKIPRFAASALSSGRYDLIIEAFFSDIEHLLSFVSEKLGTLPEATGVEASIILRVDKLSFEWEIPLEG